MFEIFICTIVEKCLFKKANNEIPGKRGLYIGFHNSCQASLENNTYEYIISLYTYNFWNFTKCSSPSRGVLDLCI